MKEEGFVPEQAKSVAHEARNGVMMCPNHHIQFDQFYFYLRWLPGVGVLSLSVPYLPY
jgi:hypothetical protein